MHYYDKEIENKEGELQACKQRLERGHFEAELKLLTRA